MAELRQQPQRPHGLVGAEGRVQGGQRLPIGDRQRDRPRQVQVWGRPLHHLARRRLHRGHEETDGL